MTNQRDDTELVRSYLEKGLPLPPGEYIVRETIVLPPSPEPSAAPELRPILTCNEALIEKLYEVARETDDGEASDALCDAAAALTGLMGTGPRDPDNELVICPTCTSQFRAIPVNVQELMATAAVMVRDTGVCRADGLNRREVYERLTALHPNRPAGTK